MTSLRSVRTTVTIGTVALIAMVTTVFIAASASLTTTERVMGWVGVEKCILGMRSWRAQHSSIRFITPKNSTVVQSNYFVTEEGRGQQKEQIFYTRSLTSETSPVPPLTELLDGFDVVGDVSWMLDFAIVGNAKCGSTFLLHYLSKGSNQTFLPRAEVCRLSKNRPDQLVKLFYNQSVVNSKSTLKGSALRLKQGLKCPKDLATEHALPNYARYFPGTDFIVTVRHPILWFQSFYNYRSYGAYPDRLPPPSALIGTCVDGSAYACYKTCVMSTFKKNVCTDRAKFHHQLSRMGKTSMNTSEELSLLRHEMAISPVQGKVFLLELGQLTLGTTSASAIPRDLATFLRLDRNLPELLPEIIHRKVQYPEEERKKYFIDICDSAYADIRSLLLNIGAEAATWIGRYFLQSPDVVVSSREEFLELIEDWKYDPCLDIIKMRRVLQAQNKFDY